MVYSVQYGNVHGVDKPVSRLVQGTVMIGSEEAERSFELLDEVRELGCTAFDTAHLRCGQIDTQSTQSAILRRKCRRGRASTRRP